MTEFYLKKAILVTNLSTLELVTVPKVQWGKLR